MRKLAPALGLALAACAGPQAYPEWAASGQAAHSAEEIKQDAERFLAKYEGQRLLVEGYFQVTMLDEPYAPEGTELCSGNRERYPKYLELELSLSRKVFERAVEHWVVVEAKVSPPRLLRRGGGDLVVESQPWEQYLVLDDARLVAIDDRRICARPRG